MARIKIGVYDGEKEYAEGLSVYLQSCNKEKWSMAAFTEEDILLSYLQKRNLDVLVGTNRRVLQRIQNRYENISLLWLANSKEDLEVEEAGIEQIYRYQSGDKIAKYIENIVHQKNLISDLKKQMIAVYSPVGRCGKTVLAMEIIKNPLFGKWLYFGLEDYSSFSNTTEHVNADNAIYYMKERNEGKLLALLEDAKGMIVSATSVFDIKQIVKEDLEWFGKVIEKSSYKGVLFDIGTGAVSDYEVLQVFDCLIVPYLEEETAQIKKERFLSFIKETDIREEKIQLIDMGNATEVMQKTEKIFGGMSFEE